MPEARDELASSARHAAYSGADVAPGTSPPDGKLVPTADVGQLAFQAAASAMNC